VLWIRIRIRKDPKLFAGFGGYGFGSGSETGYAPFQKSSKNNFIIMTLKKVNLTFSLKSIKYHENAFFIVGIVKERIFRVGSETGSVPVTFY
jgi:hypothetical protein